jgi:hypothetical protein
MAQSYIDKYVFALMLDSSNFEKGANLATKAANGIKNTLLKTYAALGGIDLFKSMLTTYTDAARNIDSLSLTTGENIVKLQAWEKAIQDTGGNINAFRGTISALDDSLAKLSMGQVDERFGAMLKLGVSAFDASGKLKKGADLLLDMGQALNQFEDNAMAFTWAKAMGLDESTFKLMRRYGDGLESAIKQNERWAIITQRDIENGRAYDKMISRFKTSWQELSKTIMSSVLPVIQNDLFPEIEKLVKYFETNKDQVKQFFENIGEGVREMLPVIVQLAEAVGTVAGWVAKGAQTTGAVAGTVAGESERLSHKMISNALARSKMPALGLGKFPVNPLNTVINNNINGNINVNSTKDIPAAVQGTIEGGTSAGNSMATQITGGHNL